MFVSIVCKSLLNDILVAAKCAAVWIWNWHPWCYITPVAIFTQPRRLLIIRFSNMGLYDGFLGSWLPTSELKRPNYYINWPLSKAAFKNIFKINEHQILSHQQRVWILFTENVPHSELALNARKDRARTAFGSARKTSFRRTHSYQNTYLDPLSPRTN